MKPKIPLLNIEFINSAGVQEAHTSGAADQRLGLNRSIKKLATNIPHSICSEEKQGKAPLDAPKPVHIKNAASLKTNTLSYVQLLAKHKRFKSSTPLRPNHRPQKSSLIDNQSTKPYEIDFCHQTLLSQSNQSLKSLLIQICSGCKKEAIPYKESRKSHNKSHSSSKSMILLHTFDSIEKPDPIFKEDEINTLPSNRYFKYRPLIQCKKPASAVESFSISDCDFESIIAPSPKSMNIKLDSLNAEFQKISFKRSMFEKIFCRKLSDLEKIRKVFERQTIGVIVESFLYEFVLEPIYYFLGKDAGLIEAIVAVWVTARPNIEIKAVISNDEYIKIVEISKKSARICYEMRRRIKKASQEWNKDSFFITFIKICVGFTKKHFKEIINENAEVTEIKNKLGEDVDRFIRYFYANDF